ncbi:MAG: SgcJ/EcaC family oxidoreductase [Chitinophagales bacterium]|nr:SgcJ/EcaC family oxidoreductase [Chitinophagales bacterium]
MEQSIEKSAIQNLLRTYEEALNTSDVNKVLQVYTDDGVFMPTTLPTAKGKEQLKASYEHVFQTIQLNVKFSIEEIVVSGDVAFAQTSSQGTVLIHANGQTAAEENREFFFLNKENEEWKISRYMFNKAK